MEGKHRKITLPMRTVATEAIRAGDFEQVLQRFVPPQTRSTECCLPRLAFVEPSRQLGCLCGQPCFGLLAFTY